MPLRPRPAIIPPRSTPGFSASAIDKVTRLFSAGLADIFTETLQNSRRGGANRVAATIEQDGDITRVTLADDGAGIADPAVLLTFGESGWKAGIAEAEDAAGLGLLALSRRGCTLRWRLPGEDPSPGYRLVLEPAHFLGRDAAHVVSDDSAPWPHGTAVTFEASEAPHAVRAFLEAAARHYPLPVTIDGESVERRAFLDGALHAEPWKGLVFGVFKDEAEAWDGISAEQAYDRLPEPSADAEDPGDASSSSDVDDSGSAGGPQCGNGDEDQSNPSDPTDDNSPQEQDEPGSGSGSAGSKPSGQMPASHDPCGTGEVMDADERRDDTTGQSGESPLDTPAEEQAWDEAMHQAASLARAQGNAPDAVEETIRQAHRSILDWAVTIAPLHDRCRAPRL